MYNCNKCCNNYPCCNCCNRKCGCEVEINEINIPIAYLQSFSGNYNCQKIKPSYSIKLRRLTATELKKVQEALPILRKNNIYYFQED